MRKKIKSCMKRMSSFKFKSALFLIGIVLLIYLITGLMLSTIHASQVRSNSVVIEAEEHK